MGNIGQHYYDWRYKFFGQPGPGTGTPYQHAGQRRHADLRCDADPWHGYGRTATPGSATATATPSPPPATATTEPATATATTQPATNTPTPTNTPRASTFHAPQQ